MTSLFQLAKVALLAAVLATPAAAAVVVPGSGNSDYDFFWSEGVGPIERIGGTDDTEWSLTLTTPSIVSFTATDDFIVGDAFELLLDGVLTPWTTVGTSEGIEVPLDGFFQGNFLRSLSVGSYLFSLQVSAIAPGVGINAGRGRAFASFSVTPAVVPVPAGGLLLITAIGGLALLRRRKRA